MTESAPSTVAPDRQMNGSGFLLPKPRKKPFRMNRERRARIEAAVDGLLHLLDELDGDPDLERGDNEDACTVEDYRPWPGQLDPDSGDGEPWLGWTATVDQTLKSWRGDPHDYDRAWSQGRMYTTDGEESYDGREPSLGAIETVDQSRWGESSTSDREPDGDEGDYSPGDHFPYLRCLRVRTIKRALVYVGEVLSGGRVRVLEGRRA
jgi:hypothetical protein